jgi:hypothetical protein
MGGPRTVLAKSSGFLRLVRTAGAFATVVLPADLINPALRNVIAPPAV